ncbi:MAG: DNA polymerase III subunit delta [Prevotellaceae bacterium]|jgi:DNA polymerase-3 subunit delta'|nr:DNA polymerase III subunit delta [Prevotellaceae bacterium]
MLFSEIIGQQTTKEHFVNSVKEQRIPHAQLVCGKMGTGTLPLAIAYAQYLCCTDKRENDACGVCPSCKKYAKLAHPDLHFVFPVIKPTSSAVVCDDFIKQWREINIENPYFSYNQWLAKLNAENKQAMIYANESEEILRKLSLKSYESEYKVMIIWQPEKMHESAANKLLKILEEPPAKTLFILVSENPDALLITIQSRTQRVNVPLIEIGELQNAISERLGVDLTEAHNIARIANGDFIKATELINASDEEKQNFQYFVNLMRSAYAKNLKELKKWADEVAGIGRERQKSFLAYAQKLVRENFIMNLHQADLNYLNSVEQAFSGKFSPFIHERNVSEISAELALAERHIEQNVNAKMVFFDLALKIIVLLHKK